MLGFETSGLATPTASGATARSSTRSPTPSGPVAIVGLDSLAEMAQPTLGLEGAEEPAGRLVLALTVAAVAVAGL